ncbi:MAG: ARMT1-like domain-containing protein [Bacteroidales bacterium]|nr:ARMT1-like domain-containing protein [Bacteroidales bacterium]
MNTKTVIANHSVTFDDRCANCFLRTYQRLFKKFDVSISQKEQFLDFFHETIRTNYHMQNPEKARLLNKIFCQITGVPDPYSEEKDTSNKIAKRYYKKWRMKVLETENPFDMALRLAIAGNIIDYGASDTFNISETIDHVLKSDFAINDAVLLKRKIKESKKILYIGDNAGEIVFDKLFIETMMHNDITYAVKGSPVMNDVTIQDAIDVGMDWVADLISNGYDAPSTILSQCSDTFLKVYDEADLIISKGQGNLEGLFEENNSKIFFLLMIKCDVIAEILKVKKGDFVVYNQN